jgi:hypothetical protein
MNKQQSLCLKSSLEVYALALVVWFAISGALSSGLDMPFEETCPEHDRDKSYEQQLKSELKAVSDEQIKGAAIIVIVSILIFLVTTTLLDDPSMIYNLRPRTLHQVGTVVARLDDVCDDEA